MFVVIIMFGGGFFCCVVFVTVFIRMLFNECTFLSGQKIYGVFNGLCLLIGDLNGQSISAFSDEFVLNLFDI